MVLASTEGADMDMLIFVGTWVAMVVSKVPTDTDDTSGKLQLCGWSGARPVGNVTGYPGVFQSNPHPYPSKPVPTSRGMGFHGHGSWVYKNPRVPQPAWGYAFRDDQ